MAPVQPPAKVLVTGANGYIAAWVVRSFLEDGYSVRGTVRSESKGAHLKKIFASYGDKFEVAVVDDISKAGAFDEAVKGIDIVVHTASPFFLNPKHPDELIIPAVSGTTGILESAKRHAPTVKRAVVLASCASVLRWGDCPAVFDETSWNEPAVKETREKGANTPAMVSYRASKTLAEKGAWEYMEKNKGSVNFDLVVLNPPFVWGPAIHEVTSTATLNQSMAELYRVLTGVKSNAYLVGPGNAWIDVRDLARAHVLAVQKADAGGERIIICAGAHFWQQLVDVANEVDPNLKFKGAAGQTKGKPYYIAYDTSKMKRVLGLQCRTLKECIADSLDYYKTLPDATL